MTPLLTPTRRKLAGNAVWLYGLQGLNYLAFLAVLPYLIRTLGIERFGLIAFAQAFAQYFIVFTDYGFNLSATKRIALARSDAKEVSRLFWAVILIKLGLMLIGAFILALLLTLVPRFQRDAGVYAIAYLAVVGSVLLPVWLFQGMEKMRYNSIVSGSAKVISVLLIFVFVHHPSDYRLALALQSGGTLLAGIAGFWSALRSFDLSFCRVTRQAVTQALESGWHLFVSSAAATLYANSYVFLVGILAGNTEAGYFGAAEKISRSIIGVLGPITQAIYPHISIMADASREMAVKFLRKGLALVAGIFIVPSIALLVFTHPIAVLMFGSGSQGSLSTLRWLAMLPFVLAVSTVLAIHTMIPFGLEKQLSRIYVFAGVASLAAAIPTIRHFGSSGAGACLMIVETVVVTLMWVVLQRHGVNLLYSRANDQAEMEPDLANSVDLYGD
jgi:PST family polysaccharide transporter